MKGAFLLSKTADLFGSLANHLLAVDGFAAGFRDETSVLIISDDGDRFMFYDRSDEPSSFEEHEIPKKARELGYCFGYMVECRSESLFCDLVGSTPFDIDILVCDNDGQLFRPSELRPESISL